MISICDLKCPPVCLMTRPRNVLFLCTGNSARSILAEAMNIVITVCANAAGETCPVWPGHPHTAHWAVEDPAAVTGSRDDIMAAFAVTFDQMKARVDALLALGDAPVEDMMPGIRAIGDLP